MVTNTILPTGLAAATSTGLDNIIVASGPALLTATPAVLAKRINSQNGVASFFDFGAVGDGVTDDTAAVQLALRSGIPICNPRHVTFLVTSTISAPNVHTYVRGGIILSTAATGNVIELHHTSTVRTDWDDIEIRTNQENPNRGLSITYDSTGVLLNRHLRLTQLGDGLAIGGTASEVGAFGIALYMDNVHSPDIGRVHIRGRRNLSATAGTEDKEYLAGTIGIYYTSTDSSQPTVVDLSKAHVRAVETCYQFVGAFEGLTIEGGQGVNCRNGIIVDFTDVASPPGTVQPGVFINNVHINAAATGINIIQGYEIFVTGCEIYRFSNIDNVNFVGIKGTTLSEANISNNLVSGSNTTGTPGTVAMMELFGFKRSRVAGNIGRNLDSGIRVENVGSIYNHFIDNQVYNGAVKADFDTVVFAASAVETGNVVRCAGARLTAANTGIITVLATTTNIIALNIPDAIIGERYRVSVQFRMVKGGTGGVSAGFIVKSGGTGTATFEVGSSIEERTHGDHAAGVSWRKSFGGEVTVTASGSVQLVLQGTSAGSNSTVAIGEGWIGIERIR